MTQHLLIGGPLDGKVLPGEPRFKDHTCNCAILQLRMAAAPDGHYQRAHGNDSAWFWRPDKIGELSFGHPTNSGHCSEDV